MRSRISRFCLLLVLLGIVALGALSCAGTPGADVTPFPIATRPPATRPVQAAGTTPQLTGAAPTPALEPTPAATTFVHRVQRGEMLKDIARQYGVPVDELIRLNQIDDPDLIKVGQEILIPATTGERAPQGVCSCLGNLYNCPDFGTQAQAQACFAYCRAIGEGDVHQLDRDGSGIVCSDRP